MSQFELLKMTDYLLLSLNKAGCRAVSKQIDSVINMMCLNMFINMIVADIFSL